LAVFTPVFTIIFYRMIFSDSSTIPHSFITSLIISPYQLQTTAPQSLYYLNLFNYEATCYRFVIRSTCFDI